MKKEIKKSLVCGLAIIPLAIPLTAKINSADEISTYDLPSIEDKPKPPVDGGDGDKPVPPIEGDGDNDKPKPPVDGGGETDKPKPPVEGGGGKPEKPVPPVVVPEIKEETNYTTSFNNIILKQNEVNANNIITKGNIEISKTIKTYKDDVLIDTTITNEPVVIDQIDNTLGVHQITYRSNDSKFSNTITVVVVKDSAFVSTDNGLAININNDDVTITQKEAQALTNATDFINLNQVSAIDCDGNQREIGLVDSEAVKSISKGKIGQYEVTYGIKKDDISTFSMNLKSTFLATAKINVIQDSTIDEVVDEIDNPNVSGVVSTSDLANNEGNIEKMSIDSNTDLATIQNKQIIPGKKVNTGVSLNIPIISTLICLLTSLVLYLKRK